MAFCGESVARTRYFGENLAFRSRSTARSTERSSSIAMMYGFFIQPGLVRSLYRVWPPGSNAGVSRRLPRYIAGGGNPGLAQVQFAFDTTQDLIIETAFSR